MSTKRAFLVYLLPVLVLVSVTGVAGAQTENDPSASPAVARPGEVIGNNVYVRSGPSTNHYPVLKLSAGSRLTIVGEEGEWLQIRPPEGTFSLISGQYVDTIDNKKGVINGDNVRVRAGSSLPDFAKMKYVVQLKLSRGAEVTILAENPDGFLRINPPDGVTLWISSQFVKVGSDDAALADSATAPTPGAELGSAPSSAESPPARTDPDRSAGGSAGGSAPPTFKGFPMNELRRQLDQIDEVARAETEKPLVGRDFVPLIARYKKVAEQEEDELAKRYALKRVEQLQYLTEFAESARRIQKATEKAEAARRDHLAQRARIRIVRPPVPGGFDAEGELRLSAAFASKSGPRRYRLMDPTSPTPRTIGYVEIPLGSKLAVEEFLGRYVGVRAIEKHLLGGGVDPIPVYVAAELVPLEHESQTEPLRKDER